VQYDFEKPATVSECELYWFDDTGTGECRLPASWRVLYKDGEEWKPVETSDLYGIKKDQFNKITFKPVTTTGLKLEVTLQPNWSAGIEYDHLFMGSSNNAFSVVNPLLAGAANRISQDVDMVTLRINYRFGGYGAPIAARY
jgi:hypothetical protein